MRNILPKLVTFDGEARSGKGTVVSLVKDYLRDERGLKVMFIDAGQVFRVLVVAIDRAGVDIDIPDEIDKFLSSDTNAEKAVTLVKEVYHMNKMDRDALLYTHQIGVNSAKVGARPLSQSFKDELLRKWMHDAGQEEFDVVLLDGRALEETGSMLEREGLCQYALGLFFVCDPVVSAQRTLGFMPRPYDELSEQAKEDVDELVAQIEARNLADSEREVQPVVKPRGAPKYLVTEVPEILPSSPGRPMVIIDRSIEVPFDRMAVPISKTIAHYVS